MELNDFLVQAYEMKMRRSADLSPAFLSTTLSALDDVLHGGVACGSLTEVKETRTFFCKCQSQEEWLVKKDTNDLMKTNVN